MTGAIVLPPLPRAAEGSGEGAYRAEAAGNSQHLNPTNTALNRITVKLLLIAASLAWISSALASPSPAEIDRLRMHADAGRDGRALDALLASAHAGSADAQRAAGEALFNRVDQSSAAEGMRWLERAASQNDARAMILLGKTWLFGSLSAGRAPDATKARLWFERAQPNVNAQAAYYMGLIEKGGYGSAADPARAAEHFRRSAEQGLPESMYLLGNAYASGEGVDTDPREAMRWYLRAAAFEHPQALQELAHAFARGDTLLPQSDFQAEQMRRAVDHALRHPQAAP